MNKGRFDQAIKSFGLPYRDRYAIVLALEKAGLTREHILAELSNLGIDCRQAAVSNRI